MAVQSAAWRMADRLAGGNLRRDLLSARRAGASYAVISKQLHTAYGVDVTGETVRRWLVELEAEKSLDEKGSVA